MNTFTRVNVEISTGKSTWVALAASSRLVFAEWRLTSAAYSASVETNVGGVDEDAYTPTITLFAPRGRGARDSRAFYNGLVVTTNREAVCSVRLGVEPGAPGEVLIG